MLKLCFEGCIGSEEVEGTGRQALKVLCLSLTPRLSLLGPPRPSLSSSSIGVFLPSLCSLLFPLLYSLPLLPCPLNIGI